MIRDIKIGVISLVGAAFLGAVAVFMYALASELLLSQPVAAFILGTIVITLGLLGLFLLIVILE